MLTEPKWREALRNLILHRLGKHGPQTTRELSNGCNVPQKDVAPRMTELLLADKVEVKSVRRSASGLGRPQNVWALIES